ncbi:peptide chain release factor N(5)-glutamine methyltransferase [Aquisalimonas lutea]|uniref:peptide chain release factor N(5)-glutamine methyltransferase n=1 Tax=Aquisalimonas lutea TaxID=1327750 RepID=UPI0025B2CBB8|nr:peptide chain release factor N(5)-glutamine methyltransferase [Aquisalimonas lutea]MDN3516025.1 peptide chain release factor N(5)-glutamine methyltransferase [Aquisalimonas lutea]
MQLLRQGRNRLAGREADWLLAHAAGQPAALLRAGVDEAAPSRVAAAFQRLLDRRAGGEPLAYLLGTQPFRSLDLAVSPDVLIPRPETEQLVDHALALMPRDAPVRALDLGTGSGAIALALASERPRWHVTAVEHSAEALAVARANGERLGLAVDWLAGDWFSAVTTGPFDLIVSNPPYVAADDPDLAAEVAAHEPPTALRAGADGLAALRIIAGGAPAHLRPGGWLMVEHGARQAAAVRGLLQRAGMTAVASQHDHQGHDRFTAGRAEESDNG